MKDLIEENNVEIVEKPIVKHTNDQLNSFKRNSILGKFNNNIVDTDDNQYKNTISSAVGDGIVRPQRKDMFINKPNLGDD